MVEVIINGTAIDLISKGVSYTKQANDLADISTVNTSFTYSLRADKTPKNTRLFQQLGMLGDTSVTPYVKNTAQLIDNGAVLIPKGIATIKETNSEYKLYIQDGIVEVFKLIENKSLGNDLDLTELEHNKTAQTIIDSWQNGVAYRYLIADYNGNTNDGDAIDAQYQIPSINVKYLWDKVFDYLGYTYSGNFDFIDNKWITYPKPPEVVEGESTLSFYGLRGIYNGAYNNSYKQWTGIAPNPLTDVILVNNWKVRVNQTGNYQIRLYGEGTMVYKIENGFFFGLGNGNITTYFRINLYINGVFKTYALSNTSFEDFVIFDAVLQADDIVELTITPIEVEDLETSYNNNIRTAIESGNYTVTNLTITGLSLELYNTARESIDFRTVLSDFSITDFFKEVMFRGALTPFPDNIARHIDFMSLTERLKITPDNINNISGKYVKRLSETYTFGTYAQRNTLRLKYNKEEESYNDGFILVENKNVTDQKILFDSKFFTPDRDLTDLLVATGIEIQAPVVRMWEKEVKEVQGVQEIQYKPLNSRFYYLSGEQVSQSITVNTQSTAMFYKASLKGVTMSEVVQEKYNQTYRIFTDTRIHEIELALSAYDFQALPMDKLHYIEQEGQFYILNRLIWESGKLSKGEFLRVKKV